ncbi:MAG TPA: sigma-54-dependent Fis family transcriptional regulator, partial [bacterium]|nr:sigma-54-dependent Fis family transcriptional regulator [bacterium]
YRVLLGMREEIAEIRKILLESYVPASVPARVETPMSREIRIPEVEDLPYEEPETLSDLERRFIEKALRNVGGNRKRAAKILGIGERTLYRKIKEYGL